MEASRRHYVGQAAERSAESPMELLDLEKRPGSSRGKRDAKSEAVNNGLPTPDESLALVDEKGSKAMEDNVESHIGSEISHDKFEDKLAEKVHSRIIATPLRRVYNNPSSETFAPPKDIDHSKDRRRAKGHYAERKRAPPLSTSKLRAETEAELRPVSPTIHVIGTGPVGKFIAHSLASVPEPPPVTLLIHHTSLLQRYNEEGQTIRLVGEGRLDLQSGINLELSVDQHGYGFNDEGPSFGRTLKHYSEPVSSVIDNLVVTTQAHTTISALSAVKHRLRNWSTICFVQDGLGVVDEVNSIVFPNSLKRPTYMLATNTHEFEATRERFAISQIREGKLSFVKLPRNTGFPPTDTRFPNGVPVIRVIEYGWTPTARYMMRTFGRSAALRAKGLRLQDFFKEHLEKLAINAVIGPLSVVFNCSNDRLLYNYRVTQTMRPLLQETSDILCSLPEIANVSNIRKHFSAQRLETLVIAILDKTGNDLSPMLQAVRAGRKPDIDFYNGYLVKRATELGIVCTQNKMLVSMIKGVSAMKSRELNSYIPFRRDS